MKIGLGLYRHMFTRGDDDFARQAGCTRVGYGRSRGKRANPKWDGLEHGVRPKRSVGCLAGNFARRNCGDG